MPEGAKQKVKTTPFAWSARKPNICKHFITKTKTTTQNKLQTQLSSILSSQILERKTIRLLPHVFFG